MRAVSLLTACSVMLSLSGCMTQDELLPFDGSRVTLLQLAPLIEGEDIAVISTDFGEIRMRFFPSEAPNAVNNFVTLAREGFFNDRAVIGPRGLLASSLPVLISGSSDDSGKKGVSRVGGKPFKQEISANLWQITGAVSVLDDTDKGDSRLFIAGSRPVPEWQLDEIEAACYPQNVIEAYRTYGGLPEYSLEYSVFAQVVQGQEVVDGMIESLQTGGKGLTINTVEIISYDPDGDTADP